MPIVSTVGFKNLIMDILYRIRQKQDEGLIPVYPAFAMYT